MLLKLGRLMSNVLYISKVGRGKQVSLYARLAFSLERGIVSFLRRGFYLRMEIYDYKQPPDFLAYA